MALTNAKCKSKNLKPGSYFDANGLKLQVTKTGSRSWIYRFQLNKKSREMGLGAYPEVTLLEARELRDAARKLVKVGTDPIYERKGRQRQQRATEEWTFDRCAVAYLKAKGGKWSAVHHHQWTRSVETYVSPILGAVPVSVIDTQMVMSVLNPIWDEKTETAARVRGRIEKVLGWAGVYGHRDGQNPAAWRGHLENLLTGRTEKEVVHLAEMPYADIPGLLARIQDREYLPALLLQFIIHTVVRTKEAAGARWSEIDGNVWTIPASRMKKGVEHRVPLSAAALHILEQLPHQGGDEWLFPSTVYGKHVSPLAALKLLREYENVATVHGFRSSFRQWCAEQDPQVPYDVAEQSLAHSVGGATERAYQRSDLLDKRRPLLQEWSDYITGEQS